VNKSKETSQKSKVSGLKSQPRIPHQASRFTLRHGEPRSESNRQGKLFHFLLFAFAFLLGGCAPQSSEAQPPEIAYGRDLCDACGMIISEARFAAATLTTDGKTLKFDDAGEMFTYHAKHSEVQVRAWFVHDYNTQKWIVGKDAFYVVSKGVKSPMGTGVAAFADRPSAETFAGKMSAKVLSFDEIRAAKPMMRVQFSFGADSPG